MHRLVRGPFGTRLAPALVAALAFITFALAVPASANTTLHQRQIGARMQQGDAATAVRVYLAFNKDGLNPALTVGAAIPFVGNPNVANGSCQTGSLATQRADAWRCGTADPCFQNPFSFSQDLACVQSPWSANVTILSVAAPLPSFQECNAGPVPSCRQELDITSQPWALELANGARCLPFLGTSIDVAGLRANYGCTMADGTDAGYAAGSVDQTSSAWKIFYLAPGAFEMDFVTVTTAWY